jgi:hypothetical protein
MNYVKQALGKEETDENDGSADGSAAGGVPDPVPASEVPVPGDGRGSDPEED